MAEATLTALATATAPTVDGQSAWKNKLLLFYLSRKTASRDFAHAEYDLYWLTAFVFVSRVYLQMSGCSDRETKIKWNVFICMKTRSERLELNVEGKNVDHIYLCGIVNGREAPVAFFSCSFIYIWIKHFVLKYTFFLCTWFLFSHNRHNKRTHVLADICTKALCFRKHFCLFDRPDTVAECNRNDLLLFQFNKCYCMATCVFYALRCHLLKFLIIRFAARPAISIWNRIPYLNENELQIPIYSRVL